MKEISDKLNFIRAELKRKKSVDGDVCIVGVTKFQPLEVIQDAVSCGLLDLAVNYAQGGDTLKKQIESSQVRWHFVGHIQSRKVKYLSNYQMVQSLDRLDIASDLNQRLSKAEQKCKVLVEVNIGVEKSKSGIDKADLGKFLSQLAGCDALELKGLMIMPPPLEDIEQRRPFFREAKALYGRFAPTFNFDTLSMGTSEDYLIAVEEGSNMVRLGTTLFGKRISK